MAKVSRLDRSAEWREISLVLTDDAGIQRINQRHLGKTETTDVISFRYDPMPGDCGMCTGEVFVNAERASRRKMQPAAGGTWTAAKELGLYVAHGCDHLSGASDADTAGRERMRRRELRWLREAQRQGLLNGLIGESGSRPC